MNETSEDKTKESEKKIIRCLPLIYKKQKDMKLFWFASVLVIALQSMSVRGRFGGIAEQNIVDREGILQQILVALDPSASLSLAAEDCAAAAALVLEKIEEVRSLLMLLLPRSMLTVFVTSEIYTPDFVTEANNRGGSFVATQEIEAADYLCQRLANLEGLPGQFVAWLSTDAVNAVDRLSPFMNGFRCTNGEVVAMNITDLTDGTLANPIRYDETGARVNGGQVWTGTKSNGTSTGHNCNNWAPPFSGLPGNAGRLYRSDDQWTYFAYDYACQLYSFRLYCFRNDISV